VHGDEGGRTAKRLAGVLIAFVLGALLLAIMLAGARLWWVSLRGPEAAPSAAPSTGAPQSTNTGAPPPSPAVSPSEAADPGRAQAAAAEAGSAPERRQPASPAEGSAASATRSIRLAWDRSPDPSVTGYRILFGTVPGLYSSSLDVGNQTTATLNGLQSGTRYYIVAVAVDASGNRSPPSNELEVMTPAQ
jgi:hypothetical protein